MDALIAVRVPKSLDQAVRLAAKRHHLDRPAFLRAALSRAAECGLFAPPPDGNENNSNVTEGQKNVPNT